MKLSYNKLIVFKKNWTVKETYISKLSNLSLSYIQTGWYHLFICSIIVWLFYFSPSFFTYLLSSSFLPLSLCSFHDIISTCFQFQISFISYFIILYCTLYVCLYLETWSSRLIEKEFVFNFASFECINIR